MKRRTGLWALGALAATIAVAAPAFTQRPSAAGALAKLQAGLWHLRDLDNPRRELAPICIGDPALLVQVRHRGAPCSRRLVGGDDASATVHYTCPAGGYGQTLIRVETPRLAQIETQGIAGNRPFAFRVEARRVGACGAN